MNIKTIVAIACIRHGAIAAPSQKPPPSDLHVEGSPENVQAIKTKPSSTYDTDKFC
ncbi:hypothetical protein MCOR34_007997 [Pyricularia oryzae]|nr:hypothetical protein MCOR34_007997 [Pyricularia oryzae]KAI6578843.1 hypothetical protein MCOR04_006278 [Pyricularia oryzae]